MSPLERKIIFHELPLSLADAAERADQQVGKDIPQIDLEKLRAQERRVVEQLEELAKSAPGNTKIEGAKQFLLKSKEEFAAFQASEERSTLKALKTLGQNTILELEHLQIALETKQEIPAEFQKLNALLGLPDEEFRSYYEKYLLVPIDQRVPAFRIRQEIDGVLERFYFVQRSFPRNIQDSEKHRIMAAISKELASQVFEPLLLGNKPQNFNTVRRIKAQIDSMFFLLKREEHDENLQSASTEKEKVEGKRRRELDLINQIIGNISADTEGNASWGEFWKPDLDAPIANAIHLLGQRERKLRKLDQESKAWDPKMLAAQQGLLLAEYKILLNSRAEAERIQRHLLRTYDVLGDKVPPEMKEAVQEAVNAVQTDPKASDFERAYYGGNYARALEIAVNKYFNNEWMNQIITYFQGYERAPSHKSPPKSLKISFSIPPSVLENQKGFPAVMSLKALPGTQPFENTVLVERLPNGSLRLSTAEKITIPVMIGRSIRILPFPLEEDHWEMILSAQQVGQRMAEREQGQNDIQKAIARNPNLEYVRRAGSEIQEKLLRLYQLFTAGNDGGKTADFVGLARRYAGDIQSELGKFPDLKNRLLEARKELFLLKNFHSGINFDAYQEEIQKTVQDLDAAIAFLDTEELPKFLDQILNSEFDPDDFINWCKEDLVVILLAIACGIAMVSGIGAPLGVTGVIGSSALGAAGYMVGEEYGTTLINVLRGQSLQTDLARSYRNEISGSRALKAYALEWAALTASSSLLLGIAKLIAPALEASSPLIMALDEIEPVFTSSFFERLKAGGPRKPIFAN